MVNYQTLFAQKIGAVAAPTAGLHFTPELKQSVLDVGAQIEMVTLHVGAGTFLPVKSVGVVGDARRYEYVIALRAVVTLDFMTANVYPFKQEFLNHVSTRIMNEIDKVSRVVYDVSSKPPSTIEWE